MTFIVIFTASLSLIYSTINIEIQRYPSGLTFYPYIVDGHIKASVMVF